METITPIKVWWIDREHLYTSYQRLKELYTSDDHFSYTFFGNYHEAIQTISPDSMPDIIIMARRIENQNGTDIAGILQKNHPGIPFFFVSISPSDDEKKSYADLNLILIDRWNKPCVEETIKELVKK